MAVFSAFKAVNMSNLSQLAIVNDAATVVVQGISSGIFGFSATLSPTLPTTVKLEFTGSGLTYGNGPTEPATGGNLFSLSAKVGFPLSTAFSFFGVLMPIATYFGFATPLQATAALLAGVDTINGSNLTDRLLGFAGNDTINGNAGIDTLVGGLGLDTMNGGGARDVFDFNFVAESAVGPNRDKIIGFSHAQGDDIDLRTIDADVRPANPGNDVFTFIGVQGFGAYHAAHPAIFGMVRIAANGVVQITNDADMAPETEIKATGATLMSDFLL